MCFFHFFIFVDRKDKNLLDPHLKGQREKCQFVHTQCVRGTWGAGASPDFCANSRAQGTVLQPDQSQGLAAVRVGMGWWQHGVVPSPQLQENMLDGTLCGRDETDCNNYRGNAAAKTWWSLQLPWQLSPSAEMVWIWVFLCKISAFGRERHGATLPLFGITGCVHTADWAVGIVQSFRTCISK